MKPELEIQLVSKYPDFFRDRSKSPKESLMCFGCECGDGWFGILDNLLGYMADVRENRLRILDLKPDLVTPENGGCIDFRCPQVILSQVKEKYGTLRVYWHFDSEEIEGLRSQVRDEHQLEEGIDRYSDLVDGAVDFSEYLSSKTCEVTGKPGKLYSDGWCVTLCEEEARKRFGWGDGENSPEPQSS
jgi:hypothetical protein